MKNIGMILFITLALTSCSKRRSGDICISANLSVVSVSEEVTVANCGDTPPEAYVTSTLDWGDGTTTNGLSGSHSYSDPGTFKIRAMLNGEWAGDIEDIDAGQVEITITVN